MFIRKTALFVGCKHLHYISKPQQNLFFGYLEFHVNYQITKVSLFVGRKHLNYLSQPHEAYFLVYLEFLVIYQISNFLSERD